MPCLVYNQPARKSPVIVTDELRAKIVEGLKRTSGQRLARELDISQATISRVAREARHA